MGDSSEMITTEAIEKVLDERVRPDLALHGGDIRIMGFEDGVLSVRLLGQCSGCPSADLTMESIVDTELKKAFPQIGEVVLVTGVSDSLIEQAKAMLKKRHEQ